MKALRPTIGLIFLSMFVINNSMAQKANYTNNKGLTLGIGAGMSYQKSDLLNSKGYGFDFTLGSPIYHKENAFLGVDWKFRFLAGANKAYDHRINTDDTYSNIRYSFFNYDLELGLTLNRLRERTGIVLTGFAGAGLTHGRTNTDIYDAGNNLYDYSGIDPNQDSKSVYEDLVALSDGDFETRLVNKLSFLPTAGLFLGYQFSRSFTLGIEYKTNFYLTEENSFVGIDLDNKIMDGSRMDRNNYVSLGFKWKLKGGSSSYSASTNYVPAGPTVQHTSTVTGVGTQAVTMAHPSVKITDPSPDAKHTESPNQTIRATIANVKGAENVSFFQNGFPNNHFTYNANTLTFIANIRLREGENTIRISASNQGSTAEDQATITLDIPPEIVISTPSAEFTSPWRSQITSSSESLDVTARLKNISSKQDIQLTQNGQNIPFEYNPEEGLVRTNVLLTEGYNDMLITASNESGSAQDQLSINYSTYEEIALPIVRFVNPHVPIQVNNRRFPLSAKTSHIGGKSDLTVNVNGSTISNYSYSASGEVSVSLFLSEGVNTVEIIGRNDAGMASDRTSLTYYPPVYHEPVYNEPVYNEPVHQAPVVYNDPVRNEPVRREPVRREPVQNEPVRREPVRNEPARRDPVRYEPSRRDPVRRDPVRRDPVPNDTVVINDPPVIEDEDKPCSAPTVTFRFQEVNRTDGTHELSGKITGVKNKSEISLTLDGKTNNGFQFVPNTGALSGTFKLTPGSHKIVVTARNSCGSDSKSESVSVEEEKEEEACGPRINPGNSAWQFCLITPRGTYSRDDLTDANFSYSGSASSLYFMPIAGGGDVRVNGKPYSIKSGQYYLFTGNLQVTVSTMNPGSMGHWSVCLSSNKAPVSGNGNKRPESPCQVETEESNKGKGNKN